MIFQNLCDLKLVLKIGKDEHVAFEWVVIIERQAVSEFDIIKKDL